MTKIHIILSVIKIIAHTKCKFSFKGPSKEEVHGFLNPFLQLEAEKKDSKNRAARNFFGPSYFEPTLGYMLFLIN